MTSYHLRISCCVCGVTSASFNMSVRIVLVSVTGMLEYMFVMSKEAREWCGSSGVSLSLCIRFWVFFTLKTLYRGAMRWIFSVNSLDSLHAEAFLQFTTGLIGWSGLCILISPLMEGAEGFMFLYFHLEPFGIRVVLPFILCSIWVWNELFGSVMSVRKVVVLYKIL